MSEDDVNRFRIDHLEAKGVQHDANFEKINEKMTDVEKYNIRQENSQKEMTTAIRALTANLKAATDDLKEIKDRPLQTHKALIRAMVAVAIAVTAFAIENGIMFYVTAITKGLTQ